MTRTEKVCSVVNLVAMLVLLASMCWLRHNMESVRRSAEKHLRAMESVRQSHEDVYQAMCVMRDSLRRN